MTPDGAESFGLRAFDELAARRQLELGHRSNVEKWLGLDGDARRPREVIGDRIQAVIDAVLGFAGDGPETVSFLEPLTASVALDERLELIIRFGMDDADLIERRIGVERRIAVSPHRFAPSAVLWLLLSRRWPGRVSTPDGAVEPLQLRRVPRGGGFELVPADAHDLGWGPLVVDAGDAVELAWACGVAPAELIARAGEMRAADRRAGLEGPANADDRIVGALLGGAVGDALGFPIEFDDGATAERRLAEAGGGFIRPGAGPLGAISDDTQLTMFTAEALARRTGDDAAAVRQAGHGANLAWYRTQCASSPAGDARGLAAEPWLSVRRAPGATMMSSLAGVAAEARADRVADAANDSKGCGTVMRSAPFGLILDWSPAQAYGAAAATARLTHGHPSAATSAGAFAMLVRLLVDGHGLAGALGLVLAELRLRDPLDGAQTDAALRGAIFAAGLARPSRHRLEALGEGWVAEEALAIAVYAALSHPGPDEVGRALALAVAHGGDSDSTGSICGNLLGAVHGSAALPEALAQTVEGAEQLRTLAAELRAAR